MTDRLCDKCDNVYDDYAWGMYLCHDHHISLHGIEPGDCGVIGCTLRD